MSTSNSLNCGQIAGRADTFRTPDHFCGGTGGCGRQRQGTGLGTARNLTSAPAFGHKTHRKAQIPDGWRRKRNRMEGDDLHHMAISQASEPKCRRTMNAQGTGNFKPMGRCTHIPIHAAAHSAVYCFNSVIPWGGVRGEGRKHECDSQLEHQIIGHWCNTRTPRCSLLRSIIHRSNAPSQRCHSAPVAAASPSLALRKLGR